MARGLIGLLIALLLVGLAVAACGPSGSRRDSRGGGGGDDDDSSTVTDDDDSSVVVDDDDSSVVVDDDDSSVVDDDDDVVVDDDDSMIGPYEDDWTGTSVGYIRFGAIEYTCAGYATVHVDSQGMATGEVTCALDGRPGYSCDASLPVAGLYVDGAEAPHDVPCTGYEFAGVLMAFDTNYLIGQITETVYDDAGGYDIEVIIDYDMVR